jgi:hypothetical protein
MLGKFGPNARKTENSPLRLHSTPLAGSQSHYKKAPFCLLSSVGCRRPSSFPMRPTSSSPARSPPTSYFPMRPPSAPPLRRLAKSPPSPDSSSLKPLSSSLTSCHRMSSCRRRIPSCRLWIVSRHHRISSPPPPPLSLSLQVLAPPPSPYYECQGDGTPYLS